MGPLIFRAFYTMGGMARCHPNVPSNYDIAAGRVLWPNGVEDVGLWVQYQADEAVDLKITVEQREHK